MKLKTFNQFVNESNSYNYLSEEINGVTIKAEDADFSTVHEFGYIDTTLTKDTKTFDVKFLVVQPSSGSFESDLWYLVIEDEDYIKNYKNCGLSLDSDGKVLDEDITEYLLDAYHRQSTSSETFGDIEIEITDITADHIIETGYVMTSVGNDDENCIDVNFDVIQPSDGDWYVAISERNKESLKEAGIDVETREVEFTGGYTYDCLSDEFNFILDWYDSICNNKRPDYR